MKHRSLGYDDRGRLAVHRLEIATGGWTCRPLKNKTWTSFTSAGAGKAVLYAVNGGGDVERGVVEFNLESGSERYVYRPARGREDAIAALTLSRDHRRLAFEEGKRLVVLDMDSGKTETIGAEGISPQSWSPEGRYLLVGAGNNKALAILSLEDGKIKAIDLASLFPEGRLSGILGRADWSPDRQTIAFAGSYGKLETFVLRDVIPDGQK